jgi:hypothetical protein
MMLTDLADALRAGGCKVVEAPGWKTRGREWSIKKPKGLLCHHTAGSANIPAAVGLVRDGRKAGPGTTAVSGPLSQMVLDPTGTFHVIAAGRSNHAGPGIWQGITNGGANFLGIEAMNRGDGIDVWEPEQMHGYAHGAAALAKHYGFPVIMVAGHKEYRTPRGWKIDPTFDMPSFRAWVADIMDDVVSPAMQPVPAPPTIGTVDPKYDMLRRGAEGRDVLELQKRLRKLGYKVAANGIFGWETLTRVKEFQAGKGLAADGVVGPITWRALA